MSFQSQVLEALTTITERLNAIATNAKRIFELPWLENINVASKFHIDLNGTSHYITLEQLKEFINPSSVQVVQEVLIPETNNQTTFLVPGAPKTVMVSKGRVPQIQDTDTNTYDFDYNPDTGVLVTTRGLKVDADPNLTEKLFVTGFSDEIGTVQVIEATQEGQTEFFYSGAPSVVYVLAQRSIRLEGIDFERTKYSSNNKLTLTKGVSINTPISVFKL